MSSWLDLIDDGSLDRFVSAGGPQGGDDVADYQPMSEAADNHDEANEAPGWETAGVVSGDDEDEEDATIPPPVSTMYETFLLNASAIFDEEDSSGGVTILPSVSSSYDDGREGSHPVRVLLAAPPLADDNSVSTMEDSYQSTASLSQRVDSLASSLLTDLTRARMISSVSSDDESYGTDASSSSMVDAEDVDHRYAESDGQSANTQDCEGETLPGAGAAAEQRKLWYSRFRTEQDWDEFRTAANELLSAVDCSEEDRDDAIAQLIAAEEDAFWKKSKANLADATAVARQQQQPKTWLLEVAAGVAAVAVVAVALLKLLKGR